MILITVMTTSTDNSDVSQGSLKNHFLIAMQGLKGDYFAGTITYMIEHSDEGAFGVVINRPLELEFGELFVNLPEANRCLLPILDGGPVGRDRVFFLHNSEHQYKYTEQISDEISLTTSLDIVHEITTGNPPARILTILGYAGWDAGQLENELAENVWLVSPAISDIIFDTPYELRPEAAASLLGIDLHLVSNNVGHG
jgi:putative transcriptional regulator